MDEPNTPGQRKERPRNRVGNFLASAFRSPPSRTFLDYDLPFMEPDALEENKLQVTGKTFLFSENSYRLNSLCQSIT